MLPSPIIYENYEGMEGSSVLTEDNSLIEFDVEISESGFYYPFLTYYPVEGKSSDIQRSLFVDGKLPYNEMALIEFYRLWELEDKESYTDENGITIKNWRKDNQGNDLKPRSVEVPQWISSYYYDSDGYISKPLAIYLTKGRHTISMLSLREPMLIHSLSLKNAENVLDYAFQDRLGQHGGFGFFRTAYKDRGRECFFDLIPDAIPKTGSILTGGLSIESKDTS